ncbi:LPS export ABC transporter periplasmic protein LptC [Croceiramulus getboli]|nr:LPS export ABC transporter periplasmic protein LptC [Flavobacteriaceae bacterium YJPT1-3]
MRQPFKHLINYGVTAIAVTLFFGCQNNTQQLQQYQIKSDLPVSEGFNITTKYTDSGRVVATLKTPYYKDFSTAFFPYEEFPEGIQVTFIDEDGEENYVTSKYAIRYRRTNLIDLQKDVVLITSDSVELYAQQLYWDEARNWVFTDQPYTIQFPDGSYNKGDLFDSSQDFENFISLNNVSKQYVKDDNTP